MDEKMQNHHTVAVKENEQFNSKRKHRFVPSQSLLPKLFASWIICCTFFSIAVYFSLMDAIEGEKKRRL
ncbi:hypothetical protein HAX54_026294, partial [Datura stramonium]|nr:hypothetical protein [Datura stramonium]